MSSSVGSSEWGWVYSLIWFGNSSFGWEWTVNPSRNSFTVCVAAQVCHLQTLKGCPPAAPLSNDAAEKSSFSRRKRKIWLLWMVRQRGVWLWHLKQQYKSGLISPPVKNGLSLCLPPWGNSDLKPPTPIQVTVYMNTILSFHCLYWNNLIIPNNFIIHYRISPKGPPILQ